MSNRRRHVPKRERRAERVRRRRRAQIRNRVLLWGGLGVVVAAVAWGVIGTSTGGSSSEVTAAPRDRVLGEASAPVTIVEYGDFKCPFCARFHAQTEPRLREELVDTGVVRFVWRDFPNIDSESPLAAQAGRCADEQGRFWELHDVLFDYVWGTFYSQGVNVEGESAYEGELDRLAGEAGLDVEAFRECVDSGRFEDVVEEERDRGSSDGVRGTPTFFVNGQKVVGAQPFDVFARLVEAEADR